jgi:hypothetical protein
METPYRAAALFPITANAFSGPAAFTRFSPATHTPRPALSRPGVPTRLVFPIGVPKLAATLPLDLVML